MYLKLIVAGVLGKDPEQQYTSRGTVFTTLSVAASRAYKNADGELVRETTWIRAVCWGKMGEFAAQYLRKGSRVMLDGRLNADPETGGPRVYQRKNGTWGAQFDMTVETLKNMTPREQAESGPKPVAAAAGPSYNTPPEPEAPEPDYQDQVEADLPF